MIDGGVQMLEFFTQRLMFMFVEPQGTQYAEHLLVSYCALLALKFVRGALAVSIGEVSVSHLIPVFERITF